MTGAINMNFAAIMRECLIFIMNGIPQKVSRPDAFWQAQAQVVKLRQHCERVYNAQFSQPDYSKMRRQADRIAMRMFVEQQAAAAKPVETIAAGVLARLEAGETVDQIIGANGDASLPVE